MLVTPATADTDGGAYSPSTNVYKPPEPLVDELLLCKILMQTDTDDVELFNRQKEKFKLYRTILRKSFRNVTRTYFEHIFTQHKNDIKKLVKH